MKNCFTISKLIHCTLIMFTIACFDVSAQQAKKISLQGFLKDANGKAVPDGQQSITFKLYAVASGGNEEWSEDQTLNVFGGVYSTNLGAKPNTVPNGVTDFGNLSWGVKTYYVGVTVQGTELTPRTELTFAPYSLGSPKAQEVVCSGAVGDVKYSILNPTQFAAVNGSCWVPMDGRALGITDKLRQITEMKSIPNGGGLFIRSQEFSNSENYDPDRTSSSPIAALQEQSFASHQHEASLAFSGNTTTGGSHTHNYDDYTFSAYQPYGAGHNAAWGNNNAERNVITRRVTIASGDHNHSYSGNATGITNNTGQQETRPKNLNLWAYIRIN